ncbi:hypothetical protein NLJ89_g4086 [Agrocybe chaxingu]|uniref:Fungal lipase-type domain-containing protein n=1 Tax=Agrocybe chaxingu TaxID=84603 RepID=A0A9W8MW96_9AGAR|nr:hypothetical protein NLJ89_g4086 [Agrocybe chaxingu]
MLPPRLPGILTFVLAFRAANAGPTNSRRQSITPLSSSEIAAFKPFSYFASTAYCNPSVTINWSCGGYVGYSPSQESVIVAHQGTNPSKIQADATDVDALLENLDSTLFPGVDSSVEVHSGFAGEQAKTAPDVLSAVNTVISTYGATQVTIVGHSLGAAIALLDGVCLPLQISGVSFRMIGYGMPRVGNQAFANYIDAHLAVTHINNKEDFVPIIPGMFLGYRHPSGEVHIMDNGQWVSCPGQDNPSTECIVGDVPNVFDGVESDHDGPYDTVEMGC